MDDESYIIDEDDYIIYDCEVLDDDDNAPVATLIRQGEKSTTRRVTSTLIEDKPRVPLLNEDYFSSLYSTPPVQPTPPTQKKSSAPSQSTSDKSAAKPTASTPKATGVKTTTKTSASSAKAKTTTTSAKQNSDKTNSTAKASATAKQSSASKTAVSKPATTSKPSTSKKAETDKSATAKDTGKTPSSTAKTTAAKDTPVKKATTSKQTTTTKTGTKSTASTKATKSETKETATKQTATRSTKSDAPAKKMPVAAVKLPKDQQQKPKAVPASKPKTTRANNLQSALGRASRANINAVDDTPQRVQRYDFDPTCEIIINGKIVKLDSYVLAVNNNLENDIMANEKATPATKKSTETVIIEGAQGVPHGKFVIKRTDNDNFVFKLFSANNKVVAISAGFYTSLSACKSGIQSVINNAGVAPIEDQTLKNIKEQKCPKWIIYNDKRDEVRLRLIATNGNMVATTNDGYLSKDAAKKGIDAIARAAQGAEVVRNDDLW